MNPTPIERALPHSFDGLQAWPLREGQIPPGDDDWMPELDRPSQPFDLWTRANFGEVVPYPISPLTLSFMGFWGERLAGNPNTSDDSAIARRLYGRLYANEGALRHSIAEMGLPLGQFDAIWGSRRPDIGPQYGLRPLRLVRRMPEMLKGALRKKDAPKEPVPQETATLFAQIDAWLDDFRRRDWTRLDDRALWDETVDVWQERALSVMQWHVKVSMQSAFAFAPFAKVVNWWGGNNQAAQSMITSLSGVFSAEIGSELREIAQSISAARLESILFAGPADTAFARLRVEPTASAVIRRLDAFLARHGHRCPAEVELLLPRWSEQPEQVIDLLRGYVRAESELAPASREEEQRANRLSTEDGFASGLDPVRRIFFRFLLTRAQSAIRRRDNSRYYVAKSLLPLRLIFAEMGRRWVNRGELVLVDDIFFLLHREIAAIVAADDFGAPGRKAQAIADARRLAYEFWFTVEAPEAIGPDLLPITDAPLAHTDPTILSGIAASRGCVSGIARLIDDPRRAAHLQTGDILVTRSTDPGWTPVFPLVGGLVLEIGGQLSHGAIVAREYGIPAVTNVYGAMQRIPDGHRITVDGTNGRVILEENTDA